MERRIHIFLQKVIIQVCSQFRLNYNTYSQYYLWFNDGNFFYITPKCTVIPETLFSRGVNLILCIFHILNLRWIMFEPIILPLTK